MKLFRKIAVAAASCLLLVTSAMAAGFAKTLTYTEGQFSDVPASEWYAKEVGSAYELGLMNGKGDGTFDPDGNVTVAEALTIASRASAAYSGDTITPADGEWYQMYVNYAESKGMIQKGAYKTEDFDRPAKRYEVATFFAKALPTEAYAEKNAVTYIPDVTPSRTYYEDVLMLYKAGIVMGSDAIGTFNPEHNITRAEAAAIINRAALPENRLTKTLDKVSQDDAYLLAYGFTNNKHTGISSGWLLDNRGGSPRTDVLAVYGALVDIYDDAGAAYIREFNKITTGIVRFDMSYAITGPDGIALEMRNDTDDVIYEIKTVDGAWQLKTADGGYIKVFDIDPKNLVFDFVIDVDLDNARSATYINDTLVGVHPLLQNGKKVNLYNFRVSTDREKKPAVSIARFFAYTNYCYNNIRGETLSAGTAKTVTFTPAGGDKVIADFEIYFKNRESVTYSLMSDDKQVAVFASDDKNFYLNGVRIYENYYNTMYYRFRLTLDMNKCEVSYKINGGTVTGTVPFIDKAASVNTAVFDNSGNGTDLHFGDTKIFRYIEHEDYVPVPVVPKGEDKWNVGVNVCGMWLNGFNTQGGWATITPYDEAQPALGYYDEGNPEAADWEIKYMVEHGIDFQAVCVFFGSPTEPQSSNNDQLYYGFMNAKYMNMSRFAVLWENAGGASPADLATFKDKFVPYFVEQFFKHPCYMTIDNKPVFIVYNPGVLNKNLGGVEGVREGFDYMREQVKKLGFDDMIILYCGSSTDADYVRMGFDGVYAYNWGTGGASPAINTSYMLKSADGKALGGTYTVPSVSVGFSSVGWKTDVRYGLMSREGYAETHDWVQNEYLPGYATEDWQKNFVMLSTWNEYGEGTYIMPTTEEDGFRYLDVIREKYTDETENASVDVYPTEDQLARITHLYPQYRRLLRRERLASDELKTEELAYVATINGKNYGYSNGITDIHVDKNDGAVTGITSFTDGNFFFNHMTEDIYLEDIVAVELTVKAPAGRSVDLFYITDTHPSWSAAQNVYHTQGADYDNEYETVLLNVSGFANWDGRLKAFRVDPGNLASLEVGVKDIRLFTYTDNVPSRYINIDGVHELLSFTPMYSETGDMLVPFDPQLGLDFQLRLFHLWNKEKKQLTLYGSDHTFVFTVGSDKYMLDGAEKNLGYKLPSIDGLPYVPLDRICDAMGYDFTVNLKKEVTVTTPLKQYYIEKEASKKEGCWEFNYSGDPEGWNADSCSFTVGENGYMHIDSDNKDPRINFAEPLAMDASKYTKLEFRVRYRQDIKYRDATSRPLIQMFFGTNLESGITSEKSLFAVLDPRDTDGEWVTVTIDTDSNEHWKGIVNKLRFDPITDVGYMDVDYIRFLE